MGKSSLFNALCGRRISIVDPTAGVTRDRIAREIRHDAVTFTLTDTGGMNFRSREELAEDVEMQIEIAVEEAEVVAFVVDSMTGLMPLDGEIAQRLRQAGKRVILVVNKCDNEALERQAADFFSLGFDDPVQSSIPQRRGAQKLLDRITSLLPEAAEPAERPQAMKLAIVGRRNVGKSTLVNMLAQEPRVIVSEIPGTTRDSVDVRFKVNDMEFIAIDTAGMRRKKQITDAVAYYSFARARASIKRADVVIHLMDAPSEVSRVDKKLAALVVSSLKPCVIAVNKMDLAEGIAESEFHDYVRARLPALSFAPLVCLSALTGANALALIEEAQKLHEQSFMRVKTAELNDGFERITARRRPPSQGRKRTKIFYITQVGVKPPSFVLFTNHPEMIDEAYRRYLANSLRASFGFKAIPLRFITKGRTQSDKDTAGTDNVS